MSKFEGKALVPVEYLYVRQLTEEMQEKVADELRDYVKVLITSMGLKPTQALETMDAEALREEMKLILESFQSCEIGGDQTLPMNVTVLQSTVDTLRDEVEILKVQNQQLMETIANMEFTSDPEQMARMWKKLREIEAKGISMGSQQYVQGHATVPGSDGFDPTKQSSALCNFTYGDDHGILMDELRSKLKERNLATEEGQTEQE